MEYAVEVLHNHSCFQRRKSEAKGRSGCTYDVPVGADVLEVLEPAVVEGPAILDVSRGSRRQTIL